MPVTIRSARAGERREIPDHWEACSLRPVWRLAGLGGGALAAAAGIGMMVAGAGGPAEAGGAFLAAVGSVALTAAVRCRRWTVTVGPEWVRTGAGPFERWIPRRSISAVHIRDARGFARLYAGRTVMLELEPASRRTAIPSDDPAVLAAALGAPEPEDG